jgi:hypothetical protein
MDLSVLLLEVARLQLHLLLQTPRSTLDLSQLLISSLLPVLSLPFGNYCKIAHIEGSVPREGFVAGKLFLQAINFEAPG